MCAPFALQLLLDASVASPNTTSTTELAGALSQVLAASVASTGGVQEAASLREAVTVTISDRSGVVLRIDANLDMDAPAVAEPFARDAAIAACVGLAGSCTVSLRNTSVTVHSSSSARRRLLPSASSLRARRRLDTQELSLEVSREYAYNDVQPSKSRTCCRLTSNPSCSSNFPALAVALVTAAHTLQYPVM